MIRAKYSRAGLYNFIAEGETVRFHFAFLGIFEIADALEMISADLLNGGVRIS